MTRNFTIKFLCLCTVLLLAIAAWTQGSTSAAAKYDPTKEVKVKGTVEEVKEVPGEFEGTRLVVKSGDKTTVVRLAPAQFLKEIDCWIKVGDQVEVVGAKVVGSSEDEVLAREVTFGNNTMVLRDQKGVPIWTGWKPPKSGA